MKLQPFHPTEKKSIKLISWAVVSGHEHDYSKVIVIVQDVSEIKLLTQKLRENEEKFRLLFENAGMGIGYYDLNGDVITFNEKAMNRYGRETNGLHRQECNGSIRGRNGTKNVRSNFFCAIFRKL